MARNSISPEVTTERTSATTHTANKASKNASDQTPTPTSSEKVVGVVLGLAAIVTLMLLSFLGPVVNSGAKDLPLAVSGSDHAVSQLTQSMEHNKPGAFKIKHVDDAEQAVHDREAIGGIAL